MARKNPLRERFEEVVNAPKAVTSKKPSKQKRTKVNINLLDDKVELLDQIQLTLRNQGTKRKKQELWEEAIDLLAAKYEVETN